MLHSSDFGSSRAAWNLADLVASFDGDEALATELVGVFLAESPQLTAAVRAAVESGDAEAVRQAAHALKGAIGNFTTGAAYAAAAHLEQVGRQQTMTLASAGLEVLEREMEALRQAMRAAAAGNAVS